MVYRVVTLIDKNDTTSSHVEILRFSLISSNFVSWIVLKFVGVPLKHLNLGHPRKSLPIFRNLQTCSEIFGKCSGMLVWPSEKFWKIFGNLRKVVRNLCEKIIKYAVISMFQSIIKRTLHVSSKIWVFCSVARTISHFFVAPTREILSLPLKHKIHIFSPLCNILYYVTNWVMFLASKYSCSFWFTYLDP